MKKKNFFNKVKTIILLGLVGLTTIISGCSINVHQENKYPEIIVEVIKEPTKETENTLTSWNNGKDFINILLIGQDKQQNTGKDETSRSDCMIVININKNTKSIKLISFMKDLYVDIPEHQSNRMNEAYRFGGIELLSETLHENFGIEIDATMEVNFENFKEIIDSIGGVEINITEEEMNAINKHIKSINKQNGVLENEGLIQEPGANNLNGTQAMAYASVCHIGNLNFDLTKRQQTLLLELTEKIRELDIFQIIRFYKSIPYFMETEIDNKQMSELAQIGINCDISNIETYNIPEDTGYTDKEIRGMAVLVPDLEKCNEFLSELEVK